MGPAGTSHGSCYPSLPVRSSLHALIAGLLILLGSVVICGTARAQVSCEQEKPHVTVAFVGSWAEPIVEAALSDLSAALGPQRMGACQDAEGPRGEKSVSLVKVELKGEGRVRIEVDDSLTNKTVARDILLDDSTDSASALIVAVAIDELLRATWAELSIKKEASVEPAPAAEPERAPLPPPPSEPEPVRLPTHRVALEGALDAFVEGSVFFGANIVYGSSILGRVEWSAFAGPRVVRANNASELGGVRADALTFGGRFDFPLIVAEKFSFGPELGLAATHAWFRGQAQSTSESAVEGGDFQGWALTARGGLGARLLLGEAFVAAATRVGYPLIALEVRDDSEVVGGLTGLEWSNGLSLGWWWR